MSKKIKVPIASLKFQPINISIPQVLIDKLREETNAYKFRSRNYCIMDILCKHFKMTEAEIDSE